MNRSFLCDQACTHDGDNTRKVRGTFRRLQGVRGERSPWNTQQCAFVCSARYSLGELMEIEHGRVNFSARMPVARVKLRIRTAALARMSAHLLTMRSGTAKQMSDKEFQAKTAIFQAQFLKLFNAQSELLNGNSEESKSYRAYVERLSAIVANNSIDADTRNDLIEEEQEGFSPLYGLAEKFAGSDDELLHDLTEAILNHERMIALVSHANSAPRKRKPSKARATASA